MPADAAAEETTTEASIPPDPAGRVESTCAYVLGDFTVSRHGYRFIADVTIHNTGNVGIIARAHVSWAQLGSGPIISRKLVRVGYGSTRTVHFLRVATQDEIDLHQNASGRCDGDATITDTFGEAH